MQFLGLLFVISALITGCLRWLLRRHGLIDLPNARSSHTVSVPRGGGLAIVITFLAAVAWTFRRHLVADQLGWALIGGGLAIAIVGFLDDRFHLAAWPRILVHSLAAAWAVWCFHSLRAGQSHAFGDPLDWARLCAAFVALVWLTNLFNFMDGIDALAGMEAVCVSTFGGLLLFRNGSSNVAQLSWMLAAASLGFLVWNWPPAKIFMGDVGSGFLGFTLGTLALFSSEINPNLTWAWLILLAVFIVDSTITLLRRMFLHARWYEAHRSHAYQHAAQISGSHAKVTIAIAVINIFWLLPLAWAASLSRHAAPVLAAVAILPLVYLALRFKAGVTWNPSGLNSQDRSDRQII